MTKPTHLLTIGFALTTALAATAGCRQPAPQPKADKVAMDGIAASYDKILKKMMAEAAAAAPAKLAQR